MKTFIKILIVLVAMIGAFAIYINATWETDFSAEYPVPEVLINADSAMIAHGKYLVNGPAHCTNCHLSIDQIATMETEPIVMKGGFEFTLPLGKLYAPNITPDPETGIGRYSDGEIYRMLRDNITPSGRATIDLMPFTDMSDYDIKSIIAYLRTQAPVNNSVPEHDLNLIGKMVMRFIIKPATHDLEPPLKVERDSSIIYGEYLAKSVANCRGCHTARDLQTGEYIGPYYAGGMVFDPSPETGMWTFHTPNITFHEGTGIIANWTERDFMTRMRAGRVYETSPMPWTAFRGLDDSDLKAIYSFLKTVVPVDNQVNPIAVPPQE